MSHPLRYTHDTFQKIFCAFFIMTAMMGISTSSLHAQFVSPGKLSTVHAQLEGVDACTKCHSFGNATFRANCLVCHTEIKLRIDKGLGYHFLTKKLECVSCHKEHHGRDFKLIRWEPDKFDHRQTGFSLEGKHVGKDCKQCHTPKNIVEKDILRKSDAVKHRTYLGLEQSCGACHDDEHRGQLDQNCAHCHSSDSWKNNSFSHAKVRFQLAGKHASVACVKCHPQQSDNRQIAGNTVFLKFKDIPFKGCIDCHEDHHKGKFGTECANCHTPADWKSLNLTQSNFDHNKTHFPLEGKHAKVACADCHGNGDFKKFTGKDLTSCLTCHEDYHAGQFAGKSDGGDCKRCHTVVGFLPSRFELADHKSARFQLTGAHVAIPCDRCHKQILIGKKKVAQFHWENFTCTVCHEDYHAGQFALRLEQGGCQSCHFVDSWHTMELDHSKTTFALQGKHLSTVCAKCHKTANVNGRRTVLYKIKNTACENCHTDYHQEQLRNASGATLCERCHSSMIWTQVAFDHSTMTKFELTGKHAQLQCNACHKKEVLIAGREPTIKFKPLGTKCSACHADFKQ